MQLFSESSWGPKVKLAGRERALTIHPLPVSFFTDRSKAVALVLFLHFVAICSFVVPALLSVFFSICVVMLALWSPFYFAFCFTSCIMMLAFWSASTAAHFAFCSTSCD